jgi:integrase
VQIFLNDLLDSGLRPKSVMLTRTVLVSALKPAVQQGKLPRNVASLTDAPKDSDPFQGSAMSADDVKALLGALQGQRLERLYRFLLLTGCRKGEALALTWDDVNPDAATLTFRVSKTGRRTIGLSANLVALLKAQRTAVRNEQIAAKRWDDHGLVFPSSVGTRITDSALTVHFKRSLFSAGIDHTYRIHDLRHTAITLMAQNGVPIRTVMELVGHKRIETTLEIYSHASQDDQGQAIATLERLFGT